MGMLTWFLNLFRTEPAPEPPVKLVVPTYVGHESTNELYSTAAMMKTFMDTLLLPEGCTWFFLQPGKNQVKLTTRTSAESIRAFIADQFPEMEVKLYVSAYNNGTSKYQNISFGWKAGGGVLNDWCIEISNPY